MTAQSNNSDQRYFPRWEVENDVYYHVDNESHPRHAKTKDLNCAGACIKTAHTFEPQDHVQLAIQLAPNKVVKVSGRVMWSRPSEANHHDVGLLFEGLTEEDKDLIFDHAFETNPQEIVNRWFSGWEDKS